MTRKKNIKKQKPVNKEPTLADYDDTGFVKEKMLQRIAHENHITDMKREDDKNILEDDILRNLRAEQIHISYNEKISEMSKLSNNLYNEALYEMRTPYFHNKYHPTEAKKKIPTYNQLAGKLKSSDNFMRLPAQTAQATIMLAVEAWSSWDKADNDYKLHPEKNYTGKPKIPQYRKKGGEYILIFTNQQCNIESVVDLDGNKVNWLVFSEGIGLQFEYPNGGHGRIKTRLNDKKDLREVRTIPQGVGYKVEIVYKKVINEDEIKKLGLDINNIIGIDVGVNNTVAIANNIGLQPIIVKGGILKATNQWFNKVKAELYSIYMRQQKFIGEKGQKVVMGNKFNIMSDKRTSIILDIMHKISRHIIDYCIEHKISRIVIGWNKGIKQNVSMGKVSNQNFVSIPFYKLIKLLKYKAEEFGIELHVINESHTSKCSFLDGESVEHHSSYVGKRIKRGLFRTLKGIIINADVNAAYNIIRKVFPDAFRAIGIVGAMLHPKRLSIKDLL